MSIRHAGWLMLPTFITAITTSVSVQADYPHYRNAAYQPTSYSAAQSSWNDSISLPPAILPYIPFDNESPQAISIPAPQPHYQQSTPAKHSYLSPARQKIIQAANRQMGIKYRWGGNTPREGFDCSGFTKFAHNYLNVKIPRTAAEQSRASRTISRRDLRPGDMIFFKTTGSRVNHVGIYLGDGRFIHAASGGGKVMTDDLRKNYWQKRLVKYGTFLS